MDLLVQSRLMTSVFQNVLQVRTKIYCKTLVFGRHFLGGTIAVINKNRQNKRPQIVT